MVGLMEGQGGQRSFAFAMSVDDVLSFVGLAVGLELVLFFVFFLVFWHGEVG